MENDIYICMYLCNSWSASDSFKLRSISGMKKELRVLYTKLEEGWNIWTRTLSSLTIKIIITFMVHGDLYLHSLWLRLAFVKSRSCSPSWEPWIIFPYALNTCSIFPIIVFITFKIMCNVIFSSNLPFCLLPVQVPSLCSWVHALSFLMSFIAFDVILFSSLPSACLLSTKGLHKGKNIIPVSVGQYTPIKHFCWINNTLDSQYQYCYQKDIFLHIVQNPVMTYSYYKSMPLKT